ncbi:tail fiber protein [Chromatiaceae bacterium AAb-1]|nr:tail fiber protein [Chromatiaceae bacterium AAb-1]
MDPYIGEIRLFSGQYAPQDWFFCAGQSLPVQQYNLLYSVIGNLYGGNTISFNLPDLRGRVPMGQGNGPGLTPRVPGDKVGESTVLLTIDEIPSHTHTAMGSANVTGALADPANNIWGATPPNPPGRPRPYNSEANVLMSPQALATAGGNQAHNNMQPYLALNFIIAVNGVYPVRE